VCSIDEMACRLMGAERTVSGAQALAHRVKAAIRQHVGERMTCSIGLAPNMFLGKVGSDMQKPDGLVTITKSDLPHILHRLKLTDIYGIGRRMEHRLNMAGIGTVEDLMRASRDVLRRAWGGVTGVLYYELLHGADLQFPSSQESRSISHEHVLEPALRTMEGARQFSQHLLAKAGERLRHKGYYARRMGLYLSRISGLGNWWGEVGFHETQDTGFMQTRLMDLWRGVPACWPVKVGMVLMDLVPAARHQLDLFTEGVMPAQSTAVQSRPLSPVMDKINGRFGRGAVTWGLHDQQVRRFTGHAAFQRVPDSWEF
ncbi:MAG: hypothetical protein JO253_01535, partial [Alphaproteobacteria bacterium]|nr:hypothetical protein [Alphaproteobacteria bacterium]